jgi:hypothetical protein
LTLVEGLKGLVAAVGRGNGAAPMKVVRQPNGSAALGAGLAEEELEAEETEAIEHDVPAAAPRPRAKRTITCISQDSV